MRSPGWAPWLLIALGACSGSNPAVTPAPDPVPVPDPDPPPPAAVIEFTASTESMIPGAAVVLRWEVRGAETVTLEPWGPVAGNVIQLSPAVTTTYTLQVANGGGSEDGEDAATATVTVVVDAPTAPPPDVATLEARYFGHGGVLLMWSPVATASSYRIDRDDGHGHALQPLTTVDGDRYWVSDGSTHANNLYTYRVIAVNSLGASVGVTVQAPSVPGPPEGPPGPFITALDGTTVPPGGTLRFSATTPVTWFLPQGPGSGSITTAGTYTAPAQTGLVFLGATGLGTSMVLLFVE